MGGSSCLNFFAGESSRAALLALIISISSCVKSMPPDKAADVEVGGSSLAAWLYPYKSVSVQVVPSGWGCAKLVGSSVKQSRRRFQY